MNSADTVDKVVLKFIEDQNLDVQKLLHYYFIFRSKSCLEAGLRSDPLNELKHSPDFIFWPQMHQKRLVAGLRSDPLGELRRFPRPSALPQTPSRSGCGHFAAKQGKIVTSGCFPPPLVSPTNRTLVLFRLHQKNWQIKNLVQIYILE